MKVVVLGGAGAFGSRLAEMLIRDGHQVWIAGRTHNSVAQTAESLGAHPLIADRDSTPKALFAPAPDVLIDAAGPFQTYGDDPYRLPRLCIVHGTDYLDLSDDAAFTAGITALDAAARRAGRRLLSGVSSVPAISGAAVQALAQGLGEIHLIDSAILPGNRAPRGQAVMTSILSQAGQPLPLWRGGAWRDASGWSASTKITLAPGLTRRAYLIGAPDLALFPAAFNARSVLFRAGLELQLLNRGLAALARLRRALPFAATAPRVRALRWLAARFERFGTDRGGMRVSVTGRSGTAWQTRHWTLIAERGDGPYIPGIPARTALRMLDSLPPGARPCITDLPLDALTDAMADLAVITTRSAESATPLLPRQLGPAFADLPQALRITHEGADIDSFSGRATVSRGAQPVARLLAALFRFPAAGQDIPVSVTKHRHPKGEIWDRRFGPRQFRSHLTPAAPGCLKERFGPFTFEIPLTVADNTLHWPVRRGWLLGLPLPRWALPVSDTREFVGADGRFHFDVRLSAPLVLGLIAHYRGWLVAEIPLDAPTTGNTRLPLPFGRGTEGEGHTPATPTAATP